MFTFLSCSQQRIRSFSPAFVASMCLLFFVSCSENQASPTQSESQSELQADAVVIAPVDEQAASTGSEHMIDSQTRNRGMLAVPAPGPVTIDGSFEDWDLSGRIASFADFHMREDYSVETALMWDKDYLYIAMDWKDKTPLYNMINPEFDHQTGWKSDSFALRVATDQTLWFVGWHSTIAQQDILQIEKWKTQNNRRHGGVETTHLLKNASKPSEAGKGLQLVSKKTEGGYRQEMRLPWSLLYEKVPEIAPGLKFRTGFEYVWGDPTGKTWPQHRYADNLQPGEDRILFFWDAYEAWGDVTLASKGQVARRQYVPQVNQLEGPVQFKLSIPDSAERFTVVIDDAKGKRVRNLIADVPPADYATSQQNGQYRVQLRWDGRDDQGKAVPTGEYQVRGLWHQGIVPVFDTVFYNPGTPPWRTTDGSGSWGADHTPPSQATRSGDGMIIGFAVAEGGHGIIGLGPDGRKIWGNKRGAVALTADNTYTYAIIHAPGRKGQLCRFLSSDGSYAPFKKEEGEFPFEVPLELVIPGFDEIQLPKGVHHIVTDLAAGDDQLYVALYGGKLAVLDATNLQHLKTHEIEGLSRIAAGPDGKLYGVVGEKVGQIDPQTGKLTVLPTPGLEKPGDVDVSPEGLLAVMDLGSDDQPKVYTLEGKFVQALAQQGGRPIRGRFEPQAVSHVSSLAYDAKGDLWATEKWDYPRRISVWGPDGQLVRDYIGNANYGGTGAFLHDDDPNLGYVGPVELKLNRKDHSYEVTQVLWLADAERADEPQSFNIQTGRFRNARRFRSDAGGVEREFLFAPPQYIREQPIVLFMEDDNGWRPVSAMGYVHQLSGEYKFRGKKLITPPSGDFADLHHQDGFLWNDLNGDGRVQRKECYILPAPEGRKPGQKAWTAIPVSKGMDWNNTIRADDLSFLTAAVYRIAPASYTKAGAPIYTPEWVKQVVDPQPMRDVVAYEIPEEDLAIAFSMHPKPEKGQPNFGGYDLESKELLWHYPNNFPGVHGSHYAPMPSPGMFIGPLKVLGHASVEGLGHVFIIRGNQGQDFYFTSDGLFIASVFGDSRMFSSTLGESVEDMRGQPLNGQKDEPFSGWFSRQSDGKYRVSTSIAQQAVLVGEVTGLDSIHRFTGPKIRVDPVAERTILAYTPRAERKNDAKEMTIPPISAPPSLHDGKGWGGAASLQLKQPGVAEKATVKMAYDAQNLYLSYQVDDMSPMSNLGQDYQRLFKTGDALDIQLGAADHQKRNHPGQEDNRVVFSVMDGNPVAVLMRPLDADSPELAKHTYDSPVGVKHFDRVEKREDIVTILDREGSTYTLRAAIPWSVLGLTPQPGLTLAGDVGMISSDAAGRINVARTYWSNQATGLVSDEPNEAWFKPTNWGTIRLGK